jgi:hypothetical protein
MHAGISIVLQLSERRLAMLLKCTARFRVSLHLVPNPTFTKGPCFQMVEGVMMSPLGGM